MNQLTREEQLKVAAMQIMLVRDKLLDSYDPTAGDDLRKANLKKGADQIAIFLDKYLAESISWL